jgi:hypothetical protein
MKKLTVTLTTFFTFLATAAAANAQTNTVPTQEQTDLIWMALSGVALIVLFVLIGYAAYKLIKKYSSPVEDVPAPDEAA